MKKTLRNLIAGAAAVLAIGTAQTARASHYQGSELTYTALAPGMYSVNLKLYRDCSGAMAPTTAWLDLKSNGCSPGRNVNMNLVSTTMGNPYCSQISPGCTGQGLTNYQEIIFTATVTFSAAEQACSEWLMSWTECCRPGATNIVNPAGSDLYAEAMVRMGATNSSPQFGSLVVPYVNYNQPIMLSSYATDQDGDSLVYSLVDPLMAQNQPIAFTNYSAYMAFNSDSSKYVLLPGGAYSKNYPILSYAIDWSQPMPVPTVQKFMFDPQTGSIGFVPNRYLPNSPSHLGENKYVMAVKVDEYRTINGNVTKVGSVRRDMFINVIDCGPNQNPNITTPVANGQPIAENTVMTLRPGTPLTFQFAAADGNATDVLSIQTDAGTILPGSIFTRSSASQPTGTISWTPTAADVRDQVYYFHVTVMDDACPVKGFQTHTFGVKVSATGGVTGTGKELALPKFVAYPNPFSETVSFKVNVAKTAGQYLLIYNVLGQQVDKISLSGLATGEQTVVWENAAKQASGQYVARLVSNQQEAQTIRFSKLR